jgi:hypothetical protein
MPNRIADVIVVGGVFGKIAGKNRSASPWM